MANALYPTSRMRYRSSLDSEFSRERVIDSTTFALCAATHCAFLASGAFDSITNSNYSREMVVGWGLAHMAATGAFATRCGETYDDPDLKAAGGAFMVAPATAAGLYGAGYGIVEGIKAAAAPICNTASAIMEMIPL